MGRQSGRGRSQAPPPLLLRVVLVALALAPPCGSSALRGDAGGPPQRGGTAHPPASALWRLEGTSSPPHGGSGGRRWGAAWAATGAVQACSLPALCLRVRGGITVQKLASLGDVKCMSDKLREYLKKAIQGGLDEEHWTSGIPTPPRSAEFLGCCCCCCERRACACYG
jgi:hypothetical protein